jgi:hypothetical protein
MGYFNRLLTTYESCARPRRTWWAALHHGICWDRSKQQHGSFFLGPVDFEDRVIALKKNMASPNIPTLPCSGFFGISFPKVGASFSDFREMFVIRWAHIWPTYPSKKQLELSMNRFVISKLQEYKKGWGWRLEDVPSFGKQTSPHIKSYKSYIRHMFLHPCP